MLPSSVEAEESQFPDCEGEKSSSRPPKVRRLFHDIEVQNKSWITFKKGNRFRFLKNEAVFTYELFIFLWLSAEMSFSAENLGATAHLGFLPT